MWLVGPVVLSVQPVPPWRVGALLRAGPCSLWSPMLLPQPEDPSMKTALVGQVLPQLHLAGEETESQRITIGNT